MGRARTHSSGTCWNGALWSVVESWLLQQCPLAKSCRGAQWLEALSRICLPQTLPVTLNLLDHSSLCKNSLCCNLNFLHSLLVQFLTQSWISLVTVGRSRCSTFRCVCCLPNSKRLTKPGACFLHGSYCWVRDYSLPLHWAEI